jgi:hypothetical protein
MTNTVFPTSQTVYILDFSSCKPAAKHWDLPNTKISSLKMSLLANAKEVTANNMIIKLKDLREKKRICANRISYIRVHMIF